jgi:stage III sporulation protein AG
MEEKKPMWKKPLELLGRYKYALLVAAAGVVLLLWPEKETAQETPADAVQAVDTLRETEKAMEEILGEIQGVGQVDVMLTVESGSEQVLATDTTLRYSGATASPDSYDRTTQTVTVTGSGGGTDVVVTGENYPQYRGALVVCEGGGSDAVRLQIVQAVSALTGLSSDKIAVVKWQTSQSGGDE